MKLSASFVALCVTLLAASSSSQAQDDAAATAGVFPLAAKAGVDSHADKVAPPGAVNQGAFNDKTWKFGHAFDAPPNTPIWNPVKVKMMQGGKITSVTIDGNDVARASIAPPPIPAWISSGRKCSTAAAPGTPSQKMWNACPYAKAVPGVRIPNANEFDEQHAMDLGALWLEHPDRAFASKKPRKP